VLPSPCFTRISPELKERFYIISHFRYLFICSDQDKYLSIVTPKYLAKVTSFIGWFCKVYWADIGFLLLVILRNSHFCKLNDIFQSCSKALRSCCNLLQRIVAHSSTSLAYSFIFDVILLGRSLMKQRNGKELSPEEHQMKH